MKKGNKDEVIKKEKVKSKNKKVPRTRHSLIFTFYFIIY